MMAGAWQNPEANVFSSPKGFAMAAGHCDFNVLSSQGHKAGK
jgi:hypothetical protein